MKKHGFVIDGGMSFRDRTVYVYKGCDYIKVEIDFTIDPTVTGPSSPKDTVSKVSGLKIDYPAKD